MERLIRSPYWALVWIGAACLGLMILVLPRLPDQSYTFPLALVVLGEWLFAFLISLVAQIKTLRQSFLNLRIEPACLSLAIIFFLSAIAIIFSPITQLNSNWAVSIGAGQLIIMTAGIFLLIVNMEYIHNRGQDEEINKELELQRVTSTRMKRTAIPKTTTHNKLGKLWFFSKKVIRAAEATPAVSPALKPDEPDQTIDQPAPEIVKLDPKKTLDNIPAEIRRLPSVHSKQMPGKVTDPSKPPSSTITKLQALSASGIGSVHHPTTTPHDMGAASKQEHSAPETDLRSVLNRLDTPVQNVAEELQAIAALPESHLPIQSPAPETKSSLFSQSVDQQMDEIFAKIAPIEAQQEVIPANKPLAGFAAPQTEAPVEQQLAKPSVLETTAKPATGESKLFQGKVDDQIEELFSEIVSPQAQREVADFVTEQTAVAQELKDFGRLSSKASEGAHPSTPLGTMKTIGKLLIDSQDVDNIIKKAQAGNITVNLPSARVISAVRGEGIQALLDSIDNYHGVAGSMLVGGDGLVIASTYTAGGDRDSLGVLGHGIFGNSNLAMLRLDLGKLDQMIFVSELAEKENRRQVTTILTDVEVGTLAVFVDSPLVVMLEQLLEQLSTIARG